MVAVQVRRQPRFVYLSDAPPRDVGVRPASVRFGWRLDAANHRSLAHAASVTDDVDACRATAATLQQRIADAVVSISPDGVHGLWTWRLDLDGAPVARSPHAFARRVECTRAYAQFLSALAAADPAGGVVRNFGPRALRAFRVRTVAL